MFIILLGGSKLVIKQPSVLPPKADVIEAVDQPVLVDDDLIDDDVVDLRLFSTMGPLIYIDLLQLPPQPKEVKGWVMQQGILRFAFFQYCITFSKYNL